MKHSQVLHVSHTVGEGNIVTFVFCDLVIIFLLNVILLGDSQAIFVVFLTYLHQQSLHQGLTCLKAFQHVFKSHYRKC